MKIFIDTANLQEIEEALERGFISGVTTNPSLLAKEPKGSFEGHVKKIVELIAKYKQKRHLSVEVFSRDPKEILKQAKKFSKNFYSGCVDLSVKVQVGWDELKVIRQLAEEKISVNCTACMSITQGWMAARAGARYVSFFWGRIRDGDPEGMKDKHLGFEQKKQTSETEKIEQQLKIVKELVGKRALDDEDFNPELVVQRARWLFENGDINAEIIAGSMRGVVDVRDAALAGAHIVTVPPKLFKDMISHFKTDEVILQFLNDFQNWMK